MDPLSITVSVLTLITISAQVTGLVKQFRDEVNVVDTTLNGILNDVEGFRGVLESMKETIDQKDLRGNLQTTGHVGSHWKNLSRSLNDGEGTLEQLRSLIISVSRSAKFLDAPRKHLRFKSAIAQIAEFREQIQSYRAALQLSLSTIILWNQTTLQRSADQIPDKVIPDLNRLYDEFRTLGTSLKLKIEKLQSTVANHGYHAESELMSMTNLKECVQSAADVVSTASTTLAPEASEKASVKYGSDFGDVFRKESNEPMQRWISSNTVYEYEDAEAPALDPSETSTVEAITEYQSDSDSDIENELVRALFRNGKKRKKAGDLQGAARTLKNCLSRLPTASTYSSMTSSQATSITGVSKVELLEMLTETYCEQGAWAEAKSTMTEMLAITEHQTGRKSERYLWDTYKLSEVMVKTKDFAEAHLHGRQSLRGFRKLREQGFDGYEKSLTLLIFICSEQGNAEEEEAYTALLESHQSNMEERQTDHGLGIITGTGEETSRIDCPHLHSSRRSSSRDNEAREIPRFLPQTEPGPSKPWILTSPEQETQATLPENGQDEALDTSIPSGEVALHSLDSPSPISSNTSEEQGQAASIDSPRSRPSSSPRLPSMKFTPFRPEVYNHEPVPIPPMPANSTPPNSSISKEPKSPGFAAKHVSRRYGVTIETKDSDKDLDKEGSTSYTKLLTALCKTEFGRKPYFMIGRGLEGYNCIVTLASSPSDDNRKEEVAKVTGYGRRDEARHAGAAKAYGLLTSRLAKLREGAPAKAGSNLHLVPDRSSDKEFYVTPAQAKMDPPPYTSVETSSSMSSPVPNILVSPTLDSATFDTLNSSSLVHDVTVRRAASDSRVSWHRSSINTASTTNAESSTVNPWGSSPSNLHPKLPVHRRAASTSIRPMEWTAGDDQIPAWPRQPPESASPSLGARLKKSQQAKSGAQPSVTFDAIETSVLESTQSNPDPTTPTSQGFLSKTFSLQGRSKSDDANLAKKKSLRAMLLPSSFIRSTCLKQEDSMRESDSAPVATCPLCDLTLSHLSAEDASLHVNGCLDQSSSQAVGEMHAAFELPGSDVSFNAMELPAPVSPQSLVVNKKSPRELDWPVANPDSLWYLHRVYSKRDLSVDKFEAGVAPQPGLHRGDLQTWQRPVLLLGDARCGKSWLVGSWCYGDCTTAQFPKVVSTRVVGETELVLHDQTAMQFIRDGMRKACSGNLPVILLCFDIASVESFENVERTWNHEADLYPGNVPKLLVGCKKDLSDDAARSVWSRDAYKMTAKINAKAYFETSAVTKEGLEALFVHVAQTLTR
ncbi:hypothetical protein N0V91_004239 [Didymella pomorum]|uniref:Azaphilone pigments biosynthesis cluster protein L N-terminal domain-containing protein n=1 Tax=Didymella pomorum TaxID=749634 RepID=A0A9W8ZH16_9PLEO|nr:hypothetical protein N0V91_004239 [Didymella pomorum]